MVAIDEKFNSVIRDICMIELVHDSAILIALATGIPLVVAGLVAFFWSIIQSAFQLQDQTIPFLLKIVAVSGTIFFGGAIFLREVSDLYIHSYQAIAIIGVSSGSR